MVIFTITKVMKLKLGKRLRPTPKQRRAYYQYALDVYSGVINQSDSEGDMLGAFGFCHIYYEVFDNYLDANEFSVVLPELYQYKPKKKFYFHGGIETYCDTMFWFPCNDVGNEMRIKILKEILAKDF